MHVSAGATRGVVFPATSPSPGCVCTSPTVCTVTQDGEAAAQRGIGIGRNHVLQVLPVVDERQASVDVNRERPVAHTRHDVIEYAGLRWTASRSEPEGPRRAAERVSDERDGGRVFLRKQGPHVFNDRQAVLG